jgi:hypothetical protein
MELPRLRKSRTETDDASRLRPYTDTAEPMRTILRRETALPITVASNADNELPNLATP